MPGQTIGIWCLGGDPAERVELARFAAALQQRLPDRTLLLVGSPADCKHCRALAPSANTRVETVPGSFWWQLRERFAAIGNKIDQGHAARAGKIGKIAAKLDTAAERILGKHSLFWSALRMGLSPLVWFLVLFLGTLNAFFYYCLTIIKIGENLLRFYDDDFLLKQARTFLENSACATWIIPDISLKFPWGCGARYVAFLDGLPWREQAGPYDASRASALKRGLCEPTNRALYAVKSQQSSPWIRSQVDSGHFLDRQRFFPGSSSAPGNAFFDQLMQAFKELEQTPANVHDWIQCARQTPVADQRFHVHLFLPQAHRGGVWEAMVTLIRGLLQNRSADRRVKFSLSLPADQTGLELLDDLRKEIAIETLQYQIYSQVEAAPLIEIVRKRNGRIPLGAHYGVLSSPQAMKADVWFALVDRVAFPLLPVMPLGIFVYDVIQKFLPEVFPPEFFADRQPGMTASMKAADRVIATSDTTLNDAADFYSLDKDQVALVPVACEPAERFAATSAEPVRPTKGSIPDRFILNITNPNPHKGLETMLKGYALLKKSRGSSIPPLVVCGPLTEQIIPVEGKQVAHPFFRKLQGLITGWNLQEGVDYFALGLVSEGQLLELFERCSVVVNAARYDNGTYSLIEAHYFGKKTICADYPAARWLYERFEVPVRYFRLLDSTHLATCLAEAIDEPAMTSAEMLEARERLADPKHGYARYAAQVYDVLLDLGKRAGGIGGK